MKKKMLILMIWKDGWCFKLKKFGGLIYYIKLIHEKIETMKFLNETISVIIITLQWLVQEAKQFMV